MLEANLESTGNDPTPRTSLADASLLKKIDELFACNVGQYISLPQLVVVGDQSSGKSSVLEGLTELPFPRDASLCTRFATHITFRRSAEESVTVTIMPSKSASEDHKKKLQVFKRKDARHLDAETFKDIMQEVCNVSNILGALTCRCRFKTSWASTKAVPSLRMS